MILPRHTPMVSIFYINNFNVSKLHPHYFLKSNYFAYVIVYLKYS